jgi:hypothetical protein
MDHMKITVLKISELKPAEYNPREITPEDLEKLKRSMTEFGVVLPAVVNKQNEIIGGHQRIKAAKELGRTEYPCYVIDITGNKAKLLNLALNRISGRWDTEKLAALITDLHSQTFDLSLSGFDNWELDYYNHGPDKKPDEPEDEEEEPETVTLFATFDNVEDFEEVSKALNDGVVAKNIPGQKLVELIAENE